MSCKQQELSPPYCKSRQLLKWHNLLQGNYRLTGTETEQFFSANLYVCNGKKIKELFVSTLNEKNANVRCVSSMIVVLNAKLTD